VKRIIDTNVLVVANGGAPQASRQCAVTCAMTLRDLAASGVIVLDSAWLILREYMTNARSAGQPGVGDAFLKWVLTNRANPRCCDLVVITPRGGAAGQDFAEVPDELRSAAFDPSDRKFVAVAVAHPEHPAILNAVDSDWWQVTHLLAEHGVCVDNLCPDAAPKARAASGDGEWQTCQVWET